MYISKGSDSMYHFNEGSRHLMSFNESRRLVFVMVRNINTHKDLLQKGVPIL